MRKYIQINAVIFFIFMLPNVLLAAGDYTSQKPIVRTIYLGNEKNALRFYPDHLNFETGNLYKLVIKNSSPQKHYFKSVALSSSVFTRKVQILDSHNVIIAEVKGHISEIEVHPNGVTEWWFVPVKTFESSSFYCSIKGHFEAGMKGKVSIR